MKTSLIISAALLFSTVSFAQTAAGTTVSSSATVQSNVVANSETQANARAEKAKKAIVAEKQATVTKAKAEGRETKKIASQDASVSANTQSNTEITAGGEGNKTNEKASINSHATVPSAAVKTTGNQAKEEGKAAISPVVKAKPAPIKMNAQVKTFNAIKIK